MQAAVPCGDDIERRFPIVAARVMLSSRNFAEAAEWIERAMALDGPEIVTAVTVPTLRAWQACRMRLRDKRTRRQVDRCRPSWKAAASIP